MTIGYFFELRIGQWYKMPSNAMAEEDSDSDYSANNAIKDGKGKKKAASR